LIFEALDILAATKAVKLIPIEYKLVNRPIHRRYSSGKCSITSISSLLDRRSRDVTLDSIQATTERRIETRRAQQRCNFVT